MEICRHIRPLCCSKTSCSSFGCVDERMRRASSPVREGRLPIARHKANGLPETLFTRTAFALRNAGA